MTPHRPSTDRRCYQFGPYLVDPRKRLLWRNRAFVPLTSKAFDILLVLIENRGTIVEKTRLLELVWQKTAVEENTLARNISTLRKALEDRPDDHQYILTIPGSGYQFVGDVVELDDRPEEFRQGLASESALNGASPATMPPRASRVTVVAAVVLALVAGTLVLATIRLNRTPAASPERALRQFTFHSGLQREPTWSPDGRSVAYASDRAGNSDIWIQGVNNPHPIQLTSSAAEDSHPDWSPSGQSIVFRSERNGGGLYVVPVQGGNERQIAGFGYRPQWSPDGKLVLFSSSGHRGGTPRFYLVDLEGHSPAPLRPDVFGTFRPLHAAWRPDGRSVSVWGRDGRDAWTFLTLPLDAGTPVRSTVSAEVDRRIREAGLTLERFAWSPSGTAIFFEGRAHEASSLWRIGVDSRTLAWMRGPDRLTSGTTEDGDIELSPGGNRLIFAARSTRTRLWAFPFDPVAGTIDGAGQAVTSGGAGEQDADAPDDGSKLVYRAVRGGRQEVWERTVADGRERLLVPGGDWTRTRPRWSSDGTRLAYLRRRGDAGARVEGAVAILTVDRGEERILTGPGEIQMIPSDWSADGTRLLGGCPQGSPRRVGTCVLDISDKPDGGARVRILTADPTHNLFEQRFSPDQRWISFIAVNGSDAGVSTVFVMPAAGGSWQAVTDGRMYDDKPHWAPDGRTLYFVSPRDGVLNVWGRRFDPSGVPVGTPFQVTTFNGPRRMISTHLSQMQIALTATRLFLPLTETQSELWVLEGVDR